MKASSDKLRVSVTTHAHVHPQGYSILCGIAGFTHLAFRPQPERIRDAAASILHRGPDQQGTFETDTVSLAAARLKIIDLASGDQPIASEDGDSVIVFNGEIYN